MRGCLDSINLACLGIGGSKITTEQAGENTFSEIFAKAIGLNKEKTKEHKEIRSGDMDTAAHMFGIAAEENSHIPESSSGDLTDSLMGLFELPISPHITDSTQIGQTDLIEFVSMVQSVPDTIPAVSNHVRLSLVRSIPYGGTVLDSLGNTLQYGSANGMMPAGSDLEPVKKELEAKQVLSAGSISLEELANTAGITEKAARGLANSAGISEETARGLADSKVPFSQGLTEKPQTATAVIADKYHSELAPNRSFKNRELREGNNAVGHCGSGCTDQAEPSNAQNTRIVMESEEKSLDRRKDSESFEHAAHKMTEADSIKIKHVAGEETAVYDQVLADAVSGKVPSVRANVIDNIDTKVFIQVADQISEKLNARIDETFKLRLNPEGLGEIQVTLTLMDNKVTVDIAAESKLTQALLENRAGDLKTALIGKNFEVSLINISGKPEPQSLGNNLFFFMGGGSSGNQSWKNELTYGYAYNEEAAEIGARESIIKHNIQPSGWNAWA